MTVDLHQVHGGRLPGETYECDGCAACCGVTLHEAGFTPADLKRYPPFAEIPLTRVTGLGSDGEEREDHVRFLFSKKWKGDTQCPYLKDSKCSIYDNRPDVCRKFVVGSIDCKEARQLDGREPLIKLGVGLPDKACMSP